MRLAFVVNNYPPKVGGVETHVHSLVRRLRVLGHDVLVVTLADEPRTTREDGVEVIRLREHLRVGDVLGFPTPGTTRRLVRLLREHHVEAVSVHTRFFPMTWIGLRAGRRAGAVVIHTEHGSDHVVSDSALIATVSRMVDRTLGRRVLRSADAVLGVSEAVTSFVRRLSGRSAQVFYNAIDPSPRPEDGSRYPGVERLVFVGRLVPGKGADLFVDVVAELRAVQPGLEAVILGDGPERESIAERIRAAGQQDWIRLRGRVGADDVRRELRGATLVNPTVLAEGFQTTLLEALDVDGRVATFPVPGAELLREQGYPVEIAAEPTVAALLDAVCRAQRADVEAPRLQGWYWADRAAEYEEILVQAVQGGSRRG